MELVFEVSLPMEYISLAFQVLHCIRLRLLLAGKRHLPLWILTGPYGMTKVEKDKGRTLSAVSTALGVVVVVVGVLDLYWPTTGIGKIVFLSGPLWMTFLVRLIGICGGALLIVPITSGYGVVLLGGMSAYSVFVYLDKNQVGQAAFLLILLTCLNVIAYARFWPDLSSQDKRSFEPNLHPRSSAQ